jgi:hypothetical protein
VLLADIVILLSGESWAGIPRRANPIPVLRSLPYKEA